MMIPLVVLSLALLAVFVWCAAEIGLWQAAKIWTIIGGGTVAVMGLMAWAVAA